MALCRYRADQRAGLDQQISATRHISFPRRKLPFQYTKLWPYRHDGQKRAVNVPRPSYLKRRYLSTQPKLFLSAVKRLLILAGTGTWWQEPRGIAQLDSEPMALDASSFRSRILSSCTCESVGSAKAATGAVWLGFVADIGCEPD